MEKKIYQNLIRLIFQAVLSETTALLTYKTVSLTENKIFCGIMEVMSTALEESLS